jgi:hypothetical protein
VLDLKSWLVVMACSSAVVAAPDGSLSQVGAAAPGYPDTFSELFPTPFPNAEQRSDPAGTDDAVTLS